MTFEVLAAVSGSGEFAPPREADIPGCGVTVRFAPLDLAWCEGSLSTPEGAIRLRWTRPGRRLRHRLEAPVMR